MVQNMSNGNKYCPPTTLPKWGSNKIFYFGGGMALFWLASSGVGTPIRPVLITPQWTPFFIWRGLPPIWGRYGCLKIIEIWCFGRTLASIISKCYRDILDEFLPMDTLLALLQNLKI